MALPNYDGLFNPLLQAMRNLGGSASVCKQEELVAKILKLSHKEINEIHKGSRTKLRYRLAWTRNYLKKYGLLENSARGVWTLTQRGKHLFLVDKNDVKKAVKHSL